jgi:glycine cleavage system regulatory protein
MKTSLVMTITAEDKPGLVDTIASLVKEHDGNWLESRMCHLNGRFAGILRIELPEEKQSGFMKAAQKLESQGWTIVIHSTVAKEMNSQGKESVLELVGQDRPGIVREISHILAKHKVNIEELSTETQSAPMSGDLLFHARAKIRIPSSCSTQELRKALEKIAADLMVDLTISEAEEAVQ